MVFKLQVFENVWRWLLPFTWNDHRNVHFELYDHGSAAAVNQTLRSPNIHYNRALESRATSLDQCVDDAGPLLLMPTVRRRAVDFSTRTFKQMRS